MFLNLDSHVQAMVLLQLAQAEESESWDYNTILAQLSRVYNNPNKVQEAEDKLLALHQGTDSIPVYISKFERVLYKAYRQDWPDINKISIFRNSLSPTVRNRLSQQLNLPQRYPDFVRIVQQLAGRSSGSSPGPGSSSGSASTPTSASIPGSSYTHAPPRIQQRSPDPMEIGSIGINALISQRLRRVVLVL